MASAKKFIKFINLNLFKGFKNSTVSFSPNLNLLVGGNNSGKSSILQAIYLAFYFLRLTDGISNQDRKKAKAKVHLQGTTVRSIPLPFHDEYYISEGLKKRSIRENSTKITVSIDENISFLETMTFPGGNLLVVSSDRNGKPGNKNFQDEIKKFIQKDNNFPLFIPTFSGVAYKEEQKTHEVVKFHIASGKSSEVLRNQLQQMTKKQIAEINSYLKSSFGYEIISNIGKDIYLSSFYKEGEYNNLDISSAGSGFQQILQILVYIVTSKSNIILIDEPDAHLHYRMQSMLYSILLDLSKKGKQIIIATHSQVFIKKSIENNDRLIFVDKNSAQQKPISDYEEGLKLLYENGVVDENQIIKGGTIKLVGIEDSEGGDGFQIIKSFLEKIKIKEPEYRFISNNGNGNSILPYVYGKEKIEKISLEALEIRDSDSVHNKYLEIIQKEKEKKNFKTVFLNVHEAENYLVNSKIITKFLNSKNIHTTTQKVENLIINEINSISNRDLLLDKLRSSIRAELMKIYRQISIEYNQIDNLVDERVKEIREQYYSFPFHLIPGKELFKIIKNIIHKEYKISISASEMLSFFEEKDIPEVIKKIKNR